MTPQEHATRQRAYNATPAGKATHARYQSSVKGKTTKARCEQRPTAKARIRKYQAAYYLIVTRRKRRERTSR